jgi:hypothetical protein
VNCRFVIAGTLLVAAVLLVLAGCGASVPNEVQDVVLAAFDADAEARVHAAWHVDPLPEDLRVGAEDVWCLNVTFRCWSCDYGEFHTCADSRLARLVDDQWQVALVLTEEDRVLWEARGCEPIEDVVSGY